MKEQKYDCIISVYCYVVFLWTLIAMCSPCFLDKTPHLTKILVSMIAGPLALNKAWWLSNAK